MTQADKAQTFRSLHIPGDPLVLYNIWDAGGAKALADAGAPAVATGSWAMAAAHGYGDGEAIPLDMVVRIVERIAASVDVPLTVDFEGGYATAPDDITQNVRRIIRAGAIGINFEDRIVAGDSLYSIDEQAKRIAAVADAGRAEAVPLFINARTDLFLGTDPDTHASAVAEAVERADAYKKAGADGFFIPGLTKAPLIQRIVSATTMPVNVMMMGAIGALPTISQIGIARASYGPGPYVTAMSDLTERYRSLD